MKDPKEMTFEELDKEIEDRKTWVEKELDRSAEKFLLSQERLRRMKNYLEDSK